MEPEEQQAAEDIKYWARQIEKPHSVPKGWTKAVQKKWNRLLPESFHETVGTSVKMMVEQTFRTQRLLDKETVIRPASLSEADQAFQDVLEKYKRIAAAEGAGTGAGGLILGAVDFPALLSIKMRFLSQAAVCYGYQPNEMEERLFMMYIFQSVFSSKSQQQQALQYLLAWPQLKQRFPSQWTLSDALSWTAFQEEYRDAIDVVKLLQLIPGAGAVFGAWANNRLLDALGASAKQAYRLRWLQDEHKVSSYVLLKENI
ncbi:EcsC family protein [Salsuginibacillus halophilus]|uniref:EcsC family protein n=1 Tax=Salsuginibacillus halophilus TaxID=517424 RepID=A0A2P8HG24_9BACI|nr:EcsC family protein [Salsuginibacillus halophilus]PSL45150.1 EcsC family protein [Salsuginibacillus halophilus]